MFILSRKIKIVFFFNPDNSKKLYLVLKDQFFKYKKNRNNFLKKYDNRNKLLKNNFINIYQSTILKLLNKKKII